MVVRDPTLPSPTRVAEPSSPLASPLLSPMRGTVTGAYHGASDENGNGTSIIGKTIVEVSQPYAGVRADTWHSQIGFFPWYAVADASSTKKICMPELWLLGVPFLMKACTHRQRTESMAAWHRSCDCPVLLRCSRAPILTLNISQIDIFVPPPSCLKPDAQAQLRNLPGVFIVKIEREIRSHHGASVILAPGQVKSS